MLLTDRMIRIRVAQTEPAYDDRGNILPDFALVHATDLQALIDVAEAAREYVWAIHLIPFADHPGAVGSREQREHNRDEMLKALVASVGEVT
jgi:hypothetical protein